MDSLGMSTAVSKYLDMYSLSTSCRADLSAAGAIASS